MMNRILIIDDDEMLSNALSRAIQRMGYEVTCKYNIKDGMKEVFSNQYDVVYLDVIMPDGDGLDALPKFREAVSSPEIIIMTAYADSKGAELAIKSGAWDYVKKPSSIGEMTLPLLRALQYRKDKSSTKSPVALKLNGIIGHSADMKECLDKVADAANSNLNVLISGETGTGKEIFAWAIHNNSSRANNNFVIVDCTILSETLVESMLFGHEKGAYTGATIAREGLIKQANQGTLFLDEIGELSLPLQKKFLRVLQERCFRPVGGKKEIECDFRLIAATNRNLHQMVEEGLFRKDLFFRVNSLLIDLPLLKERKEDIRDLVVYHLGKCCENYGIANKGISPEFFELLHAYDWPGNIRELINALESAIASARDAPMLFPYHLPTQVRVKATQSNIYENLNDQKTRPLNHLDNNHLPSLKEFRDAGVVELEKEYLTRLMTRTNRNIRQACEISGLSRSRLYSLLKKYKVSA